MKEYPLSTILLYPLKYIAYYLDYRVKSNCYIQLSEKKKKASRTVVCHMAKKKHYYTDRDLSINPPLYRYNHVQPGIFNR